MGSDRDYDSKTEAHHHGQGRESRGSRTSAQRIGAIRALDKALMTKEAASRIQSHTDRTGKNEDFKERAMSAADRNEKESHKS